MKIAPSCVNENFSRSQEILYTVMAKSVVNQASFEQVVYCYSTKVLEGIRIAIGYTTTSNENSLKRLQKRTLVVWQYP